MDNKSQFLFSETSRSTDCSYLNIQAINTTGDLDVRETQNIGISFNVLDDSYLTIHCILEAKVLVWQEIFDCPTEGFTQEHRLEFYIDLEKEVLVKEETE